MFLRRPVERMPVRDKKRKIVHVFIKNRLYAFNFCILYYSASTLLLLIKLCATMLHKSFPYKFLSFQGHQNPEKVLPRIFSQNRSTTQTHTALKKDRVAIDTANRREKDQNRVDRNSIAGVCRVRKGQSR